MRKPDRFARAVQCYQKDARFFVADVECILAERATRLLRRQFAAIRRMVVQRITEVDRGSQCQENVSYRLALSDLLVTLDTWRKGKP
jgi:hypothetical protein